jgi:uncharacterized protein (TIGR03086 family)
MTRGATTLLDREVALDRSLDRFDRLVRAIPASGWTAATPCAGWTVRDLVNHVTIEQMWVPPLLAGRTIGQVGARYDGDQLGAEPVPAWSDAQRAARLAWAAPGAWERIVALSFGPTPAAEYAVQLTADLVIHGWDLGRAIGVDDRPGADLAHYVHSRLAPQIEAWRAAEVFGPPIATPSDADEWTRLIALTGRRPDWRPDRAP